MRDETSFYSVVRFATHEDCDHEDYGQWLEVMDEQGRLVSSILWSPNYVDNQDCHYFVQKKQVLAISPLHAVNKYRQWLNEGLTDNYLET